MQTISDSRLRAGFDSRGRLVSLVAAGFEYIRAPRPGVWRLFLSQPEDVEIPVLPEDQDAPEISASASEIVLTYPRLRCHLGELRIRLTVRAYIVDGELHWSVSVANEEDILVSEAWCPLIGGMADLAVPEKQWMLWPFGAGMRPANPKGWLASASTRYHGPDEKELIQALHYPSPASMGWFDYHSEERGLFVGVFDTTFRNATLVGMLEQGEMAFGIVKYPLIRQGQSWESPDMVTVPHAGNWRWGAKRYRQWADSWWQAPEIPEWLKTWVGWQRTIMQHQYGEVLWTYDQLAELTANAKAASLDTLHLLGWWKGGMDRAYPHYDYDERMGGAEAWRAGIKHAREEGVRVIPYMNGRLMDVLMPFFQERGKHLTAKTILGTEYIESYPFWGRGTLIKTLATKQVQHAIPCPSLDEWWDVVEGVVRQVADDGADGLLIDQIGGLYQMLCFDESHPHDRPDEAFGTASASKLRRLADRIRADYPEFMLVTEWLADMSSQHFGFVHGCGPGFTPGGSAFPAAFRYTFPEIVCTNRNGGYDERDWKNHASFALLHGFRYDMSVHLCRGSMADMPEYSKYFPRLHQALDPIGYLPFAGTYVWQDEHSLAGDGLESVGYRGENGELGVVVRNAGGTTVDCPKPEAAGTFREVRTLAGAETADKIVLPPHESAIWLFDR
jgi:hypothetical protein